ncbi:MAG: Desulfoferrodoxin [Firmicutes bacterium ADurb.Bin193]|nr:MAG: Desulfoferrodoxin [Firmicutes bacterium ADurb.Bin193]
MRREQKFFICKHCGNLIGLILNKGVPLVCCGEQMKELKPNTTDASTEKHVPVITAKGDNITVDIGSAPHPMTSEHFIEWIYIETEKGGQRKSLAPGEAPRAEFVLKDDKLIAAFAYCNLHSLWKADA